MEMDAEASAAATMMDRPILDIVCLQLKREHLLTSHTLIEQTPRRCASQHTTQN
jgi:hypothetical protein